MISVFPLHDFSHAVQHSEDRVEVRIEQNTSQNALFFRAAPEFPVTAGDYILLPACCYKGNQFDVLKKEYPPLFTQEEARLDMPVTITDVPRLNKDGSGSIEITTGDLATPCVGIYSKALKKAFFLFTVQEIAGHNLGVCVENGEITLSYPALRRESYVWPHIRKSTDEPIDFFAGETVSLPYRIIETDCADMPAFFRLYFENRKCMGLDDTRPEVLSFEEQAEIQKEKFNTMSWFEPGEFYGVGTDRTTPSQIWQPGWVGGGISSYALMKIGGDLEWERGIKTLGHLFSTQAPSGFFHETALESGEVLRGIFNQPYAENWGLLRKSGDALYFIFKHFELMKQRGAEIPTAYIEKTRKLSDAFVTLWKKYGQIGQFVDLVTGDLTVGGSASCAILGAALVRAYEWFADEIYLEVAEDCTAKYILEFLNNGYTTGGPEEILQSPDSESAFALLESLTELYRVTGQESWLEHARFAAEFCSSWVVSYNYRFPEGSEFSRLNMKTVGAVFANVQNKHAAPGICTLSGDSLYRLYRRTNDPLYLELFRDITLTISQYMSTDKRPIYSWDVPKDSTLDGEENSTVGREKLPQGFICERVNMSDWETARCVGGVFNGSCWSETSNLLMLAECADILMSLDQV